MLRTLWGRAPPSALLTGTPLRVIEPGSRSAPLSLRSRSAPQLPYMVNSKNDQNYAPAALKSSFWAQNTFKLPGIDLETTPEGSYTIPKKSTFRFFFDFSKSFAPRKWPFRHAPAALKLIFWAQNTFKLPGIDLETTPEGSYTIPKTSTFRFFFDFF